jgi:hypothetical protein
MHGTIGLHEHYALVSPQDFSDRMNDHWVNDLDLCTSQPLRTLWTVTGSTYRDAITDTALDRQPPWRVLRPPTGSGKTQGACVYAAMQADLNRDTEGQRKPVGVLIVTRLITQANDVAKTINDIAGRAVAVAHHSEHRATPEQLHEADAVVITHQAYVNAASHSLKSVREGTWEKLSTWRGGKRLLTIVDEALANIIEENKVTASSLSQVIGYVTPEMRVEFPSQVAVLQQLHDVLMLCAETSDGDNSSSFVWREGNNSAFVDLKSLRLALASLPYDIMVLGKESADDRKRIAKRTDDVLRDAEVLIGQYSYYAQKGHEHSINTSALRIPLLAPGPVVLDATAQESFLWDLMEDRAQIIPVPGNVRDYSNVTLHVARTSSGLGKHNMTKNIQTRCPRLLSELETVLGPERSVFLCMHKDTEPFAIACGSDKFSKFATGHWGKVDGRNDWENYDTAVIFGLPYRDHIWANNVFFALQGPKDDEWLKSPEWKAHQNVRSVMEQRHLSASIIQAINRVRCRRVIDDEGRSPPADIYILLPRGPKGDAILTDILSEMPRLNVVDWPFILDGDKVYRPKRGSNHEAVLAYMDQRLPGETPLSRLGRALSIGRKAMQKLQEALRDAQHPLTQALAAMGVAYEVRGRGRGAKSYLTKSEYQKPTQCSLTSEQRTTPIRESI